jgi:outer membrane protease
MREIQEKMIMDIEIEKKIEQLEWQRDNAMRIRCPLVARKYQRMIDELAKESRNKSMNKAEQARQ